MTGGDVLTVLIANPSNDVYGSDLQMLESVAAMRGKGWRVVVALPADGQLVPRLKDLGAEVLFTEFPVLSRANASMLPFLRMVADAFGSLRRIRSTLRLVRPSVVYVNTITLPWWLLVSRWTGTPTICHLHEAETEDRWLVRKALIAPLQLASAIIVISRSTMQSMCQVEPRLRKRARLIYNGVPSPVEPPGRARRTEPWRLMVVGRLSPRKAPHLALEAVARLRSMGRDVEIELCGSAFEGYEWYVRELHERAAQPDLHGAVHFSGYMSPVWPALARSDIVVAPSLREPFGNAVVEAQLALRPVVATAAHGHLESISDGETGLLVPPGDVEAMAHAIERLLDDAELADALAKEARRQALTRFSLERYAEQVTQVVTDLASTG